MAPDLVHNAPRVFYLRSLCRASTRERPNGHRLSLQWAKNQLVVLSTKELRSGQISTYAAGVDTPGCRCRILPVTSVAGTMQVLKGRASMGTPGKSTRWLLISLLLCVTIFAAVLWPATGDPPLVVAARDGDSGTVR